MTIDVPGLAAVLDHALVVADRDAVPILPNPNLDDIAEVVLS